MNQVSGVQVLAAAAVIGASVLLGSLLLGRSLNNVTQQLDRTAGRLGEIRSAVADAKEVLANLPTAAPARQARSGPDPNRRYEVKIAGSPVFGPSTAAVTLVEFSDFQ